jgi:hypothetical protein
MYTNIGLKVEGFVKIFDPQSGEIFVDKKNAINYENMSEAIANSLAHKDTMYMYELHLGNGGTTVDPTGGISYQPTNTNASNAQLYSPTYYKIIDNTTVPSSTNRMRILHTPGKTYTDILVSCLLDYGEPASQAAFDNSTSLNDTFVFDEMGIKAYSSEGPGTGKLLTHVVFHPVQKSLNRVIQIDYTVRIQTLTNVIG